MGIAFHVVLTFPLCPDHHWVSDTNPRRKQTTSNTLCSASQAVGNAHRQASPSTHLDATLLIVVSTGEFFDLEALSQVCKETKRYTFFFTSWPLNMYVRRTFERLWPVPLIFICFPPPAVLAEQRALQTPR